MVWPLAGTTVVATAVLKSNRVESIDDFAITRLKCQVVSPGQVTLRRLAIGRRYEKFVCPKIIGCLATDWNAENLKYRAIESSASFNVRDDELDVID